MISNIFYEIIKKKYLYNKLQFFILTSLLLKTIYQYPLT